MFTYFTCYPQLGQYYCGHKLGSPVVKLSDSLDFIFTCNIKYKWEITNNGQFSNLRVLGPV